MDSIGEIIVAIVEGIVAILSFILKTLLLIIEVLFSIFIPEKRASLKNKWQYSDVQKFKIILTCSLFLALISYGCYVIFKVPNNKHQPPNITETTNNQTGINIEKIDDGINIHISDEIKDKAINKLKEKWKNR